MPDSRRSQPFVVDISDNLAQRIFVKQTEPSKGTSGGAKDVESQQQQQSEHFNDNALLMAATTSKIIAKFENEMKDREAYWRQRIESLERAFVQAERAYENSLNESEKKVQQYMNQNRMRLNRSNLTEIEKQFEHGRKKVSSCFRDNPNTIVNCAPLVDDFIRLVSQKRNLILTAVTPQPQQ